MSSHGGATAIVPNRVSVRSRPAASASDSSPPWSAHADRRNPCGETTRPVDGSAHPDRSHRSGNVSERMRWCPARRPRSASITVPESSTSARAQPPRRAPTASSSIVTSGTDQKPQRQPGAGAAWASRWQTASLSGPNCTGYERASLRSSRWWSMMLAATMRSSTAIVRTQRQPRNGSTSWVTESARSIGAATTRRLTRQARDPAPVSSGLDGARPPLGDDERLGRVGHRRHGLDDMDPAVFSDASHGPLLGGKGPGRACGSRPDPDRRSAMDGADRPVPLTISYPAEARGSPPGPRDPTLDTGARRAHRRGIGPVEADVHTWREPCP